METTNELKHTIYTKDKNGNYLDIEIRLSDDCNNGHNDFAITASAYDKRGKGSKQDRYFLYGGCSHEEILAVRPDLKIFVDLHLSDFRGVPMYAVENGFFHLTEKEYKHSQDTVRATDDEFEILKQAKDKDYFAHLLVKLGIVERWHREAKQAIELLEGMTGKKFVDDSTRLPSLPQFSQEIEVRILSGYYSAENVGAREREKETARKLKLEKNLLEESDKNIAKIILERNIKIAIVRAGLSLDNVIFYTNKNELVFNWLDFHKKTEQADFDRFVNNFSQYWPVDLSAVPEGIKFKLGNKGR